MRRFCLVLLLGVGTIFTTGAERLSVKGLSVDLPKDYDLSWFDGDSEKAARVFSGRQYGSFHVTFFKTSGNSEIEYNPSAADAREIEAFLTGKTKKKPEFYPHNNKIVFLKNLNRNTLDSLTLCEFEIENIQFTRRTIFIDAGYCYVVSISIKNVDIALPQEMPEYFQKAKDSAAYRWNSAQLKRLNDEFLAGKAYTGYLGRLIAESEGILGTFQVK